MVVATYLYADPACPWSWLAVRWLSSVTSARGFRVDLRPCSLWMRDGERQADGLPEFIRNVEVAASKQSLRVLRVFEALRDAGRKDAIWSLYLAWCERVFVPSPPKAPTSAVLEGHRGRQPRALVACAADDARWDVAIEASTRAASGSIPILMDGQRTLIGGAILSAPVTPDRGLELWDALEILTSEPSFVALSPTPPSMPSFAVDNSRGGTAESVTLV